MRQARYADGAPIFIQNTRTVAYSERNCDTCNVRLIGKDSIDLVPELRPRLADPTPENT